MPLGSYSATRAWPEETTNAAIERLRRDGILDGDKLSAEGRRMRDEIEERTDDAQQSIVDAIGDDLDPTIDQLNAWSDKCVQAKAFPPDAYKRAAG
jgi:hypothetical protein